MATGLASPASAMPVSETSSTASFPPNSDFDYQLGGSAPTPANVGIVVRDRTDSIEPGRYNVCYVNGFQTQPNEKRFWLNHRNLLLKRNGKLVIDSKWGEWLLDVRTQDKRAKLAKIVNKWVAGCSAKGFDAVEFDNLDSFSRSSKLIKKSQTKAFAKLLVAYAHQHGLAAGQKNWATYDGTQIGFDFAIAEECGRYNECGQYVKNFGSQVLMVEYRDEDFAKTCDIFGTTHPVVRRDLMLKSSYQPQYC